MKNKVALISTVVASALVFTTGGYLMGRYASPRAITPITSTTINPSTNKQQYTVINNKAINLIQEFAMGKHLPNGIGLGVVTAIKNKDIMKKEHGKLGKTPSSLISENTGAAQTGKVGGNGTKGSIAGTSSTPKQNTNTISPSSSSSQTNQIKPSVTPTPTPVPTPAPVVVTPPPAKTESPALQSVLAGNDPIIRGGNLTIAGSTLTESQERSTIGAILLNAPEPSGVTGGGGSDFFAYVSTDGQVYYIGGSTQSIYYFINTTLYTNNIPADTFHVNNQFYQELSAIGVSSTNVYHIHQAFDAIW